MYHCFKFAVSSLKGVGPTNPNAGISVDKTPEALTLNPSPIATALVPPLINSCENNPMFPAPELVTEVTIVESEGAGKVEVNIRSLSSINVFHPVL